MVDAEGDIRAAAAQEHVLELVEGRGQGGYGFHFKVCASGRLYRLEPARDPHQPRYWCFQVQRCRKGGLPDPTEQPWFGACGMARDELDDAARAIRADLDGWLAANARDLRGWLLAADAAPEAAAR